MEYWEDAPEGDGTALGKLAQGQLEEEERKTGESQVDDVRNEKSSWRQGEVDWDNYVICTSSILVAQVREAPDVAEPDAEPDHRQDELELAAPLLPFGLDVGFPHRDQS